MLLTHNVVVVHVDAISVALVQTGKLPHMVIQILALEKNSAENRGVMRRKIRKVIV